MPTAGAMVTSTLGHPAVAAEAEEAAIAAMAKEAGIAAVAKEAAMEPGRRQSWSAPRAR